jgi:hypothetical protein
MVAEHLIFALLLLTLPPFRPESLDTLEILKLVEQLVTHLFDIAFLPRVLLLWVLFGLKNRGYSAFFCVCLI